MCETVALCQKKSETPLKNYRRKDDVVDMNEPDQALNTIERHVYTRRAANYSYVKPKFAKEVRWTWCDFEGTLRTYATKAEAIEAKDEQDAELAEEI